MEGFELSVCFFVEGEGWVGGGGGGVTRVQAVGIDDSRTFIVSVFFCGVL